MHNKDIDKARLFIYNVLSLFFVEEHVKNHLNELIENLDILALNSFDEDFSKIIVEIEELLKNYEKNELYVQYQELFLVPFGNSVSLSASWHHEEREAGLMLIKVRDILAQTKIRRDESKFTAQEDNFGFIFTLCSYLIEQQINGELKTNLQKELFKEVINPFIDKLSFQLVASGSEVYTRVGTLLSIFFNFERVYLEVQRVK
ncbi:TorD/DmsD family molecular chaperone [Halarcobacter ebronensis]|uniref:Uncharacterized protein n=1 Tax=Halarcobacter ebronensis TaxID=1462615 RepID=A0A4Q1AJR7_9BACT|nr:molecular chaperone TorD family protein [Halarcobacter ebronensis]QKF81804.1 putative formate dehydrogenase-specific chaperone [Halarcobacter ebronensis]RXK04524.1 hypothetical protein CRV07_10215 [Halarcobacter ebronensis]